MKSPEEGGLSPKVGKT